jgi:hypothetical protein
LAAELQLVEPRGESFTRSDFEKDWVTAITIWCQCRFGKIVKASFSEFFGKKLSAI